MKLSSQRLNPAKAAGIWHKTNIAGEEVSFKIASQKSPAYQTALLKLVEEEKLKNKLGKADLAKSVIENKTKALELFAEHILLDWKGITDDAGKEIPYSRDLAKELVDENIFPDIAQFIIDRSSATEAYLGEVVKEAIDDAKNE